MSLPLPLEALVTEIVDQLTERLSTLVLLHGRNLTTPAGSDDREVEPLPRFWTARQVADHYEVGLGFIYQHSDELGCIRLGGGRRPRLRFDPRIVRERWALVGDTLPAKAPTTRWARRSTSGQRGGTRRTYDLIEFGDGEPTQA